MLYSYWSTDISTSSTKCRPQWLYEFNNLLKSPKRSAQSKSCFQEKYAEPVFNYRNLVSLVDWMHQVYIVSYIVEQAALGLWTSIESYNITGVSLTTLFSGYANGSMLYSYWSTDISTSSAKCRPQWLYEFNNLLKNPNRSAQSKSCFQEKYAEPVFNYRNLEWMHQVYIVSYIVEQAALGCWTSFELL